MLNTIVDVIDHKLQRYSTVGDWKFEPQGDKPELLQVYVSDMGNPDYNFLVSIHEQIEAYLCRKHDIKEEDVTAFDIEFERNRTEGDCSEPGDSTMAPYHNEHRFATGIERKLAIALDVNWEEYDEAVNSL